MSYVDPGSMTLERARNALERAFQMLELCGVPRERARSVGNGIAVLVTRMDREAAALRQGQPPRLRLYVHPKTGGVYVLITDNARMEKDGRDGEPWGVYRNVNTGEEWIRPTAEFREPGRFVPCDWQDTE